MIYKAIIVGFILSMLVACAPETIPVPTQTPPAQLAPTSYPKPVITQSAVQPKPAVSNPSTQPPSTSGDNMVRAPAFVEKSEVVSPKSASDQFTLTVSGSLPSPCNLLQTNVKAPDDQNRIQVEVYSLLPPDKVCAQVLVPFETSVPLGSLKSGSYTVVLNDKQVGELTVP